MLVSARISLWLYVHQVVEIESSNYDAICTTNPCMLNLTVREKMVRLIALPAGAASPPSLCPQSNRHALPPINRLPRFTCTTRCPTFTRIIGNMFEIARTLSLPARATLNQDN